MATRTAQGIGACRRRRPARSSLPSGRDAVEADAEPDDGRNNEGDDTSPRLAEGPADDAADRLLADQPLSKVVEQPCR